MTTDKGHKRGRAGGPLPSREAQAKPELPQLGSQRQRTPALRKCSSREGNQFNSTKQNRQARDQEDKENVHNATVAEQKESNDKREGNGLEHTWFCTLAQEASCLS